MLNNLNIKKLSLWLSIAVLACFTIAALLFYQIDIKNFKDNKYQYDVNEEKTFETGDIKDIKIDSFSSDINIIEYDDNKVKVHIYGKLYKKSKSEENKPVIEFVDGALSIKENRKSNMHVGLNLNIGELFHEYEMQIDLYVPVGYKESMNIDSSSGSVKADPLNVKELNINTFSGDIELEDVTADTIHLETSSGKIKAGNTHTENLDINSFSGDNSFKSIKADKVYFDNSSGSVSLGFVEADKITGSTFSGDITAEKLNSEDADISTTSGKITVKETAIKRIKSETFSGDIIFNNATLNDSVISTTSGSVRIGLIEGFEFALEVDSTSGNVLCDFPITIIEKQGEHEIKGVVGKDTNKIKIDTFSGDIKISK
jgi:lia operon protein LiaG